MVESTEFCVPCSAGRRAGKSINLSSQMKQFFWGAVFILLHITPFNLSQFRLKHKFVFEFLEADTMTS